MRARQGGLGVPDPGQLSLDGGDLGEKIGELWVGRRDGHAAGGSAAGPAHPVRGGGQGGVLRGLPAGLGPGDGGRGEGGGGGTGRLWERGGRVEKVKSV